MKNISLYNQRKSHSRPAGVSLIIATIFVSAFMLVIAGLAEANLHTIENMRNHDNVEKAFYLAESALELANYYAAIGGVGANGDSRHAGAPSELLQRLQGALETTAANMQIPCALPDLANPGSMLPCVSFRVVGRAPDTEKVSLAEGSGASHEYFSVPSPKSGDAATGCQTALTDENSADDPCHWNRLYVGESVEIPLYVENENPDGTRSVAKLFDPTSSSDDFKLRIRAPACVDSGLGDRCEEGRTVLWPARSDGDPDPFRHPDRDPVLVQWTIDDAGWDLSLVSDNVYFSAGPGLPALRPNESALARLFLQNTEITAGRLDMARTLENPLTNYIVLKKDQNGVDVLNHELTIQDFLTNHASKPLLHLNLVGQPRIGADVNDASLRRPYLEYQLLTSSETNVVADSKSLLIGTADVGSFHKELLRFRKRSSSPGGFVLESF